MYRGMSSQEDAILTAHTYTTTTRKKSGQAASIRPTLHAGRLLGRPTAHHTRTHTSARRPPARTRPRPSGRRAGGPSPAAPSRASRAPAARRRRPPAAAARAATLSPAPPHGASTTRARGGGGGGGGPRRPRSRRPAAHRPGRGGSSLLRTCAGKGGQASTICGPTGVRTARRPCVAVTSLWRPGAPPPWPCRAARARDSKRMLWDASPTLVHRANPSIRCRR